MMVIANPDNLSRTPARRGVSARCVALSTRGRRSRSGYVLIIVLGLAVVAFSVATAYLEAHSTVLPEAENLMASSRASYLAGSGVDMACHYLLYPPDGVADGAYWTGSKGLRVDGSSDYVSVFVKQDGDNPDIYQIDSFGLTHDQSGDERGKRGVRARVMMRPDPMVRIPYAIQCGGTLVATSSINVVGNMYSRGMLTSWGTCTGTASSSSSVLWLNLFSQPASKQSYVPLVDTPTIDVSLYGQYIVNGSEYTAYQYNSDKMSASGAGSLNSYLDANMATNPGRIVIAKAGNFAIEAGVDLYGTLIVDGDLKVKDSASHRIVAVENYPAIICNGDVKVESNTSTFVVYGTVVCGILNLSDKTGCNVSISGALVTTTGTGIDNAAKSGTSVTLTYNSHYAKYYDLSKTAMPFTVLSWSDY